MEGPAMATEKSAQELQREIDELYGPQREITERLRDPRGIRRAEEIAPEDQPPFKKRIPSAVVKVNEDHPDNADTDVDMQLEEEYEDDQHDMEEDEINVSRPRSQFNSTKPRSRVPFLAKASSYTL